VVVLRLSLGLVVALVSTSSGPVALSVRIESGITNHNTEMSHSYGLNNEENEAKDESPQGAVMAVDDHGNNSDEGEDVKYKRIYKVSNKESGSSFACSDDSHRGEDSGDNHNNNTTRKHGDNTHNQLYKCQEIDKSGRSSN